MVREFKLPDVGEGVAEGEIVRWLVEPGDEVSEDQPVAEVETDKAVVEVPSPVDGSVKELLAEEGEVVPVGDVIITFEVEGEEPAEEEESEPEAGESTDREGKREPTEIDGKPAVTRADAGEDRRAAGTEDEEAPTGSKRVFAPPNVRRLARELGIDVSSVEGSGPGGRISEDDVRAAAEGDEDEPEVEESEKGPRGLESAVSRSGEREGTQQSEAADRERTLAAPATRRLAEEQGVDLNAVPTDETRDGEPFVTPEAVREYAEARRAAPTDTAEAATAGAEAETGPREREEREPYRGIRRTIGRQMEHSKYTAPHVTHHDTAQVERLVDARRELKAIAEERGVRLTYMPFVMKAIVAALKQHPYLNSSLDEESEEVVVKNYYNVGIAVATDAGLMVPVVEDVDEKGLLQLASEVNELAQKARERSISREEMQGGTFTITNFGAIGGEYATPIINHPEVAILGLGELRERPIVEDGEGETPKASRGASGETASRVVPAHTLPLSLSIDHRIVDGAVAAEFTNTLVEYLENPNLLLLE
ncbi:dihydrolipoamide acetyltransferase family protein [Halalkalicoccus salilacus]|uniref:dihydrolipoamide acetyltransferase family protein n=1 Tax=Halalkalicoccus salilacus TaxID=3117459 RepID=UPI00300F76E5